MILLAPYDVERDLGRYLPPNDARKRGRRHRRIPSWLILVFKLTAAVLHKPAWTGDLLDR